LTAMPVPQMGWCGILLRSSGSPNEDWR
jgi:hypothetical protein